MNSQLNAPICSTEAAWEGRGIKRRVSLDSRRTREKDPGLSGPHFQSQHHKWSLGIWCCFSKGSTKKRQKMMCSMNCASRRILKIPNVISLSLFLKPVQLRYTVLLTKKSFFFCALNMFLLWLPILCDFLKECRQWHQKCRSGFRKLSLTCSSK